MSEYTIELQNSFLLNANSQRAVQQAKYMKNRFDFYGLTAPERKKIQAPFLVKQYLPKKEEANSIIKELWGNPKENYTILLKN